MDYNFEFTVMKNNIKYINILYKNQICIDNIIQYIMNVFNPIN